MQLWQKRRRPSPLQAGGVTEGAAVQRQDAVSEQASTTQLPAECTALVQWCKVPMSQHTPLQTQGTASGACMECWHSRC